MSELVVILFADEMRADEAVLDVARLDRSGQIQAHELAVAVKTTRGRLRVRQTVDVTPPPVAPASGWWAVFVGALVGGTSGLDHRGSRLWATLVSSGVDERFMNEVAERFEPGRSALLTLVRKVDPEASLDELRRLGGHMLHTSLPIQAETMVNDAVGSTSTA